MSRSFFTVGFQFTRASQQASLKEVYANEVSHVNHVGLLVFLLFHGGDFWWVGDADDEVLHH